MLGLGRAFVPEREQRTLDGLVLAPCDRSAIWLAKSLATLAFLAAAEVVAVPLYAIFFHRVGGSTIAAVVLAVGADLALTAEQLSGSARKLLSAFKVPTVWLLLESDDDVPRGGTGKVDSRRLREMLVEASNLAAPNQL